MYGPIAFGPEGIEYVNKDPFVWKLSIVSFNALSLSFNKKQVAQGQYVVGDTRCPALHDCES